jgi:hypothetical protein
VIAPTCAQVRESAAEFALDILEPHERSLIAAHVLGCPACRAEVDSMASIGSRLLELLPGTEPPLGFDQRVLARVGADGTGNRGRRLFPPHPSRLFVGVAAAVAAVVLLVGSLSLGWFHGGGASTAGRAVLTADFMQGGRSVGEVYAYAHPAWLDMTVTDVRGAEKVTCELVGRDGKVTSVGSFDLVDGSGKWGAPDPGGFAGVAGARLVDHSGRVLATARFS